jgi:hypothetical protein
MPSGKSRHRSCPAMRWSGASWRPGATTGTRLSSQARGSRSRRRCRAGRARSAAAGGTGCARGRRATALPASTSRPRCGAGSRVTPTLRRAHRRTPCPNPSRRALRPCSSLSPMACRGCVPRAGSSRGSRWWSSAWASTAWRRWRPPAGAARERWLRWAGPATRRGSTRPRSSARTWSLTAAAATGRPPCSTSPGSAALTSLSTPRPARLTFSRLGRGAPRSAGG